MLKEWRTANKLYFKKNLLVFRSNKDISPEKTYLQILLPCCSL
jgi:hypothetical protein